MYGLYVKLFREDLTHYGYEYKIGINRIYEKFNPDTNCKDGGFYFCRRKYVAAYLDLYDDFKYFTYILIPPDAKLSDKEYVSKADQIIIYKFIPIEQLDWNIDDCKINCSALKYISKQMPQLCDGCCKKCQYQRLLTKE